MSHRFLHFRLKCNNFLIDEKPKLEEVITEIHQKLDAVYVFGIGSKIDMLELELMASKVSMVFLFGLISWFQYYTKLSKS